MENEFEQLFAWYSYVYDQYFRITWDRSNDDIIIDNDNGIVFNPNEVCDIPYFKIGQTFYMSDMQGNLTGFIFIPQYPFIRLWSPDEPLPLTPETVPAMPLPLPSSLGPDRAISGRYLVHTDADAVVISDARRSTEIPVVHAPGTNKTFVLEHQGYVKYTSNATFFEFVLLEPYRKFHLEKVY